MRRKQLIPLLLILALVFLLAACGRGGGEDPAPTDPPAAAAESATDTPAPPTDTPAPPTDTPAPPTDTPEPAPTDAPEEEPAARGEGETADSGYSSASETLDSFRTRGSLAIVSTLPDGSERSQTMTLEGAFVTTDDEYGSDEFFQMDVVEEGLTQSIAIYKIGGNVSVFSDGEWITVGRDQAGMFTIMADIFTGLMDEFATGIAQAEDLGTETVNGIEATRYRINDPEVFRQVTQFDEEEVETSEEINSVEMNIWVAQEGDYVLKYSIIADVSGATEFDETGNEILVDQSVDWTFELYDPNAPVEIALPADAPEPGVVEIPGFAEGEFPLPAGAEISQGILGVEVRSDLPQDEFVQFYTDALPALGWSFEGDFGFYEVTKDDVTFNMFISTDDDSGQTVAQIFSE